MDRMPTLLAALSLAAARRSQCRTSTRRRSRSPRGMLRSRWPLRLALRNCANSLYIWGVQTVLYANRINNLATEKTGCESCRPSQFQAKLLISSAPP